MPNYGHIVQSANPEFGSGGYKNEVLFAPIGDFLALQAPAPGQTPALGDYKKIAAAHTFTSPKGFIGWKCKLHTVNGKYDTVGEDGSAELEHTYTGTVIGDTAESLEQFERIINEDIIALFRTPECTGAAQYVQLGNNCVPVSVKMKGDSKTTKEGKFENEFTMTCKKKYFYSATVTRAA